MRLGAAWPVAAAILLSGCSSADRKGLREVQYNCPANALEIDVLQKEIKQFESDSGIRIKLNPFSGQDKLYAMMAAGKAPDIFYTNSTMRDRLAAEDRILDLRTVSTGDSLPGRLWPHVIQNGTSVDGGWYSLGNWEFTCGVYYRKDLFSEAGLGAPDSSWTWNDMVSLARKLTRPPGNDGSKGRYGIFIGSHFVEALELMNGAKLPREMLLVSIPAESADLYRRYIALMDEGIMPDLLRIQAMGMQPAQLLQNGKVAMLVESVPNQSLIESMTKPWGVAPLPRFPGKTPAYFRSASGGLSISSSARDPEAAWRALKWIVTVASTYQPTPVLRDVDFAGGWEKRYPQLRGSGFRRVWDLSLEHNGGDPRFFVRFSSWTSGPILERLQPLLDQVWARRIPVDSLIAALPAINRDIRREIGVMSETMKLKPGFRRKIEEAIEEVNDQGPL